MKRKDPWERLSNLYAEAHALKIRLKRQRMECLHPSISLMEKVEQNLLAAFGQTFKEEIERKRANGDYD